MRIWLVLFTMSSSVAGATEITLTHQGRVLDGLGLPENGSNDLAISIWNIASGGTESPNQIYTETFQRNVSMTLAQIVLEKEGSIRGARTVGLLG